jgi:hypothetical protein
VSIIHADPMDLCVLVPLGVGEKDDRTPVRVPSYPADRRVTVRGEGSRLPAGKLPYCQVELARGVIDVRNLSVIGG